MKALFRVIRYSSVGVFFAGIVTAIVGCTQEEQIQAILLFLLLLLTGGGSGPAFIAHSCVTSAAGLGSEGLCITAPDGTAVLEYFNPGLDIQGVVWSPNGTQIAFTGDTGASFQVYVINADGTGLKKLTSLNDAGNPAWSPDGSRIAFEGFNGASNQVYVINADGTGLKRLTSLNSANTAAWSPDGTQITFTGFDGASSQIYVINADGTGQKKLTSLSEAFFPAWSPGGTQIAFTGDTGGPDQVYVVNTDGTGLKRLTSLSEASFPVWSPNGRQIAFNGETGGAFQVYVVNADGTDLKKLTSFSEATLPVWSPNGSRIAFQAANGGDFEIYLMDADGSNQVALTNNSRQNRQPDWNDDGTTNPTCFTADTLVEMADGTRKRIADVEVGDRVLSFDFELNQLVAATVTDTFQGASNSYLQLNGLQVTEHHPFAVGRDQWQTAGELSVGHAVVGINESIDIKRKDTVYEAVDVFTLRVADTHNFYVYDGQHTYLVHNK